VYSPVDQLTAQPDPALGRQRHRESAARTYARRIALNLVAARGVYVRDSRGDEYLDCLAGAGALALGHAHPAIVGAIERALHDDLPLTTLDLMTPAKDLFIERLFAIVPPHVADGKIQFCGPTGADAVEAAVKLAKTATGRAGLIAFGGGYHGMTQGTLALTGAHAPRRRLGPLMAEVRHQPFPAPYRCPFGSASFETSSDLCARALDWALFDDHSGTPPPAAVVIEPVQGEGGVHPAPAAFGTAVRDSARRAGSLLIVDEVQTGLGRTGSLWAGPAVGLDPDILVLSKAIGGGLPLAVIVYRRELDVWEPGAHAGTFRGNQLAMATGAAAIRCVVEDGLVERSAVMGRRLIEGLEAVSAGSTVVGEVRGRGLMVGVELVDPERLDSTGVPEPDGARATAMQQAMLARGVIVEVGGRADAVVRMLPPLIIGAEEIDRVVDAFAGALADTAVQ
jgi:diaminobutyrate-2-oxoglutarate transaminase